MRKTLNAAVLAAPLLLGACAGLTPTSSATPSTASTSTPAAPAVSLPSPAQLVTDGQQAVEDAGAIITVAQSASCLAESVLNVAEPLAKGGEANQLAKASQAAGNGCGWTNPATPAAATPAAPAS